MAGKKLINPKAKDLRSFLGLLIVLFFKNTTLSVENGDGSKSEGTGVKGYVVDVTDGFIYLGSSPEVYDTLIAIEDVCVVRVPDEIERIISSMGGGISNEDSEGLQ